MRAMPHRVRKTSSKSKPYAIVNENTGKTVGRSTSKRKAAISASIRDRGYKR